MIYSFENKSFLECSNSSELIDKDGPYYTDRIDNNDFYGSYLNLTMEEVIAVAHQPKDMIMHCVVGSVPMLKPFCDELIQGHIKMFTPTYGVCYGFNFNFLDETRLPLRSNYAGRDFGLELVLNIESKFRHVACEYIFSISF